MKADHSSIVNIKNHDTMPVSRTMVDGFFYALMFNKINVFPSTFSNISLDTSVSPNRDA